MTKTERVKELLKQGVTSTKELEDITKLDRRYIQRIKKEVAPNTIGELEYLRAKIGGLAVEKQMLLEALGQQLEIAKAITSAVKAVDPLPVYKYQIPKKTPTVIAVMQWSDWHIGEVVSPDEIEGFNQFNYAIAEQRLFSIIADFIRWVEHQRKGYTITECVIFAQGDYISGDIHRELSVTNEFPIPVQAAKAGHLMGEALRRIASHFTKITVHMVGADNHGRLQPKPQAKQKYQNSMSYLVDEIALAYTQRIPNIIFNRAKGMKLLAAVGEYRFLLEHGDGIRGVLGIPWYGLSRTKWREALRRMNTDKTFHYHAIGHFHVPNYIEDTTIVNGSLSGTTEYDHSQGRYARPAQVAFMVGNHGLFNLAIFRAVDN